MKTLPSHVKAYKRTPTFTRASVPAGLTRAHRTRAGTWGRIVVEQGRLTYRILEPVREEVCLSPDNPGVVEPEVPHEVQIDDPETAFHVEFYR